MVRIFGFVFGDWGIAMLRVSCGYLKLGLVVCYLIAATAAAADKPRNNSNNKRKNNNQARNQQKQAINRGIQAHKSAAESAKAVGAAAT